MNFCHLHIHNEYSQLDGVGTAESYIKRAKELGQKYIGLTNHGNVDGIIEWQKECDRQGVKPITGCECYIVPDAKVKNKDEKRRHIVLLVKNKAGWENLLQLLTYANLEGFYRKPRIDYNRLLQHLDGLIVLTGCLDTFLHHERGADFFDAVALTSEIYVEVMPHSPKIQIETTNIVLDFSDHFDPPVSLVATNDCHYVNPRDNILQEVLLAVQRKKKWADKDRWTFGDFDELYLKSADEMVKSFREQGVLRDEDIEEAMANTIEIAEKCCDFRVEKQDIFLPMPPNIESHLDEDLVLWDLCCDGKRNKLEPLEIYEDRLHEEFELIKTKKFSRYFLIVWELVNWCGEHDIMIGPGRGSVSGSLISYLLRITSVDPVKHSLLFSRFISEDRIDYPDIDIDFEDAKRHLVLSHLEDLYGRNSVAGISTFLRMKARMAIRDVARVFDVPYKDVDEFAKAIDEPSTKAKSHDWIKKAVEDTKEGERFKRKYPDVVKYAIALEGQVRGYGRHAAGVVISAEDLRLGKRCNLMSRSDQVVINWDFDNAEHVGLLKLDVLGLSALSILNEAKKLIKKSRDIDIVFEDIPIDDEKVFREFADGETVGCFQFNSHGITNLCKKMKVSNFEDLVAINALYRPGPLRSGMVGKYVERKNGKKWKSSHPKVENIAGSTYGILVYQEQVMQLVRDLAGFTWAESDKVRKVIGKSRGKKELVKFKDSFISGCNKANGISSKKAEVIWKEIEEFGGYGFNRSHSFTYSMIGFWCMWLKVYYPTQFICANLSYGSEGKKEELIKESCRLGLSIVVPKCGISDAFKWVAKDDKLYVPFIEIKGVGEKTASKAASFEKLKVGKNKGFFRLKEKDGSPPIGKKNKFEQMLEDIGAFDGIDEGIARPNAQEYFSFPIHQDSSLAYPNLDKVIGERIRSRDVEDVKVGKIIVPEIFRRVRFSNRELLECERCGLREECSTPVMPSKGLWNIAIIGEGPGREEDKNREGFCGAAGNDILWPEITMYGLNRLKFHVSNIVKCWPSITKTPKKEHIDACLPWLVEELEEIDCRLILAFGNTNIKAWTGADGGITKKNGMTEWNEKAKAWICWCVHPAAVLHNRKANEELFEAGIKNFFETIKSLGGINEILL